MFSSNALWTRALICAFLLSLCSASFAQNQGTVVLNPDVIQGEFHGETIALRDWQPNPAQVNERVKAEKLGYHIKGDWILNEYDMSGALPVGDDPVWQKDNPAMKASQQGIGINMDGMGYSGVNPADPSLDVGPNHVIQMMNGSSGAYFVIYDKLGNELQAQTYFDNFFGMPAGLGDPIVMYDESADRWFLSEFSASGNNMHVAISTTPDPMGTYNTYSFNAPSFPDYPKFSIWDNAYFITSNEAQTACYALDRTAMLAGAATTAQRFTVPDFGTIGFQAATPVSLNGTTAPPAGAPGMIMRMRDDAWTGASNDALELWEFDVDFVTPANTSLTLEYELPISAFDSELCGYTSFSCIPQPGSGTQLDPLREVLMNRIHYRNFGTHESIVCCHVTDVDATDRAGVRWYELRRTGGVGSAWSIYQEGTYSPDADGRFMCSIAIDAFGSIAIAYNISSSSTFPGLRYTGRQASDPLGTMTEPETVIVNGSAANGSNRYGDYNQLNCDPDGQTFWFTGMYNPSSQWSTRICSFDIAIPGLGCMDAIACNFDPAATTDSGNCTYPGDTCNDGDATTINDVLQGDCSCAGVTVPGCTNPFADNYDPAATVDDGSCIVTCQIVTLTLDTDCWGAETTWELLDDDTGASLATGGPYGNLANNVIDVCLGNGCYNFTIFDSFGDGLNGAAYAGCGIDGNYAWTDDTGAVLIQMLVADFGASETQQFCLATAVAGCMDAAACNFDPSATSDDGSCEYLTCAGCMDPGACNFDATATIDDMSCEYLTCAGCTDAAACNFDAAATIDDMSCEYLTCAGCTDAAACNFDPTATLDDASCEYLSCAGCTDPVACNFDATATIADLSCEYLSCAGCTDAGACNFDPSATLDDMTCEYVSCAGCTDPGACNYDASATLDNMSCEYLTCAGCTDNSACNYDPAATIDDGTCDLPDGCTDVAACNYDASALCDNGTCEYASCSTCFGDLDGDGMITVADLLMILGDYGCTSVCLGDINEDGSVDTGDVLGLLGVFGSSCP